MIINIIIFVIYYFLYILELVSHTKSKLPIRLVKSYIKGLNCIYFGCNELECVYFVYADKSYDYLNLFLSVSSKTTSFFI